MAQLTRVFTIPASVPFLPALIGALLEGRLVPGFDGRDPLALAGATIYLPTRRACRLARDAFLDVAESSAAILPRIVPIGDVDEDEIIFAQAAAGDIAGDALDLPQSLAGLERRLLLGRLVLAWAARLTPSAPGEAPLIANHPAAALALADDLARLIDDMTTRGVSWDRLDDLVPDQFDRYWQLTLEFLKIARTAWPAMLAERGLIEAAERRDLLIKAETARLARSAGPVIAAGSTGSIPATAELLAAIARLPRGAVVLPGLDVDLEDDAWARLGGRTPERQDRASDGVADRMPAAGHPQFALHALLARIGIARDAVGTLEPPPPESGRVGVGVQGEVDPTRPPAATLPFQRRERLLSEAFRPAAVTDRWRARIAEPSFAAQAGEALAGISFVEAANAEEEALAVAIALREALIEPQRTAALVTPDRELARRVLAALARWNEPVDDSGGDALRDTTPGLFARLVAAAIVARLAPVELLALLKHPLCRLRGEAGAHNRAVATLERAILRGPRPRPGSAGLASALAALRTELARLRGKQDGERSALHPSDPRALLGAADLDRAEALLARLREALAPLESLGRGPHRLADLAGRHREVLVTLSADARGAPAAFAEADGTALAQTLDEIAASDAAAALEVTLDDYPDLFDRAIAGKVVRRPSRADARLRILGPLEARLTTNDLVVLGGLNEGTWPPEARSDAWLSRPMRLSLGLDLPERRIGLSAHDFAQLLGASQVILTRAAKVAGAPAVASRFVQRLAAVAGALWPACGARGERLLAWARDLDRTSGPPRPVERPAPTPPLAARPTRLTVTEIEHWLRDPYTIYAKHILRLTPLDAVDTPPGAADRGTVIHGAIGEFTSAFAQQLPTRALDELLALGRKHFADLEDYPEARAFWWPRFERIARWFAEWESARRGEVAAVHAEIRGEIEIELGARTLRLVTRADRIERLSDGGWRILDYKTGTPPTSPQVISGLAPQLTLEGAILRRGCFAEIARGASIAELTYVALKGGDPAGFERPVVCKDLTPDQQADLALRRLTEVALRFEDPATPYVSRERPMWSRRGYGNYDHLARVKEWSLAGEDEAEDAP